MAKGAGQKIKLTNTTRPIRFLLGSKGDPIGVEESLLGAHSGSSTHIMSYGQAGGRAVKADGTPTGRESMIYLMHYGEDQRGDMYLNKNEKCLE